MAKESRENLRQTFDQVAELYDQARPGYPEQLFDDLFSIGGLKHGASVLEIGCGTGQATIPLARRGSRLVCLELGEHLAAVARRELAEFRQVEVITGAFEAWEPRAGSMFGAVFAATSWHWLDPAVRYAKAARVLTPEGVLAIVSGGHAFPAGFDSFFTEIQECYNAIGERMEQWPPPRPDEVPDEREDIERSELFEDVRVKRYLWAQDYTADQYVDLLNTYSGHRVMDPPKRAALYAKLRRRINARPGGSIHKHYLSILHVARLRADR